MDDGDEPPYYRKYLRYHTGAQDHVLSTSLRRIGYPPGWVRYKRHGNVQQPQQEDMGQAQEDDEESDEESDIIEIYMEAKVRTMLNSTNLTFQDVPPLKELSKDSEEGVLTPENKFEGIVGILLCSC